LETFKVISFASQSLNSYWQYFGHEGLSSSVADFERKKVECGACGGHRFTLNLSGEETLRSVITRLKETPSLQLSDPSLRSVDASGNAINLFMSRPIALRAATEGNLDKQMKDLVTENGAEIVITDPVFASDTALIVVVRYN
jgi:E2 binding domain